MLIWDTNKRELNLERHGIDFADMAEFDWECAVFVKTETVNFEQRETVIGLIGTRAVTAIYTEPGDDLRIISVRTATKFEQRKWTSEQA